MDGFDISTERIAAAATGVDDVGAALGSEIATMHDLLGQIRAGWQSSVAAPRFAAAMQGYLDQAAALREALVSQGAALAAAGRTFEQAETAAGDGIPAVSS